MSKTRHELHQKVVVSTWTVIKFHSFYEFLQLLHYFSRVTSLSLCLDNKYNFQGYCQTPIQNCCFEVSLEVGIHVTSKKVSREK